MVWIWIRYSNLHFQEGWENEDSEGIKQQCGASF